MWPFNVFTLHRSTNPTFDGILASTRAQAQSNRKEVKMGLEALILSAYLRTARRARLLTGINCDGDSLNLTMEQAITIFDGGYLTY